MRTAKEGTKTGGKAPKVTDDLEASEAVRDFLRRPPRVYHRKCQLSKVTPPIDFLLGRIDAFDRKGAESVKRPLSVNIGSYTRRHDCFWMDDPEGIRKHIAVSTGETHRLCEGIYRQRWDC